MNDIIKSIEEKKGGTSAMKLKQPTQEQWNDIASYMDDEI